MRTANDVPIPERMLHFDDADLDADIGLNVKSLPTDPLESLRAGSLT